MGPAPQRDCNKLQYPDQVLYDAEPTLALRWPNILSDRMHYYPGLYFTDINCRWSMWPSMANLIFEEFPCVRFYCQSNCVQAAPDGAYLNPCRAFDLFPEARLNLLVRVFPTVMPDIGYPRCRRNLNQVLFVVWGTH